jgi:glutamine amidotransferase
VRPPTIGIVDYGVGNVASLWHALHALGLRCRVSSEPSGLDPTGLLLLPGVGAFPAAMEALNRTGLSDYVKTWAGRGRPVLGICLGMQLLAESSTEHELTAGLGLVPGTVRSLGTGRWHIGWNTIDMVHDDPLFRGSHGKSFYFNHSYAVETEPAHRVCVAGHDRPVTAVSRRGNVIGVQFHPEKSQLAGREVLRSVINGMCRG